MMQIPWNYTGLNNYHCVVGNFVFKRKGAKGVHRYEVWDAEDLLANNLDYFGCVMYYRHALKKLEAMEFAATPYSKAA